MKKGKRMRRAQTISQPFIYMAAIIIAGFILILGTRVIRDLMTDKPLIINTVFISKIKEDLKSVSYGEIRTPKYNLEGYTCACFVGTSIDPGIISNTYIQTSYQENPVKNLFLGNRYKPESFSSVAELGEIEVEGSFTCYAVKNGILEFTVEGLGRKVKILASTDTESEKCKEASP